MHRQDVNKKINTYGDILSYLDYNLEIASGYWDESQYGYGRIPHAGIYRFLHNVIRRLAEQEKRGNITPETKEIQCWQALKDSGHLRVASDMLVPRELIKFYISNMLSLPDVPKYTAWEWNYFLDAVPSANYADLIDCFYDYANAIYGTHEEKINAMRSICFSHTNDIAVEKVFLPMLARMPAHERLEEMKKHYVLFKSVVSNADLFKKICEMLPSDEERRSLFTYQSWLKDWYSDNLVNLAASSSAESFRYVHAFLTQDEIDSLCKIRELIYKTETLKVYFSKLDNSQQQEFRHRWLNVAAECRPDSFIYLMSTFANDDERKRALVEPNNRGQMALHYAAMWSDSLNYAFSLIPDDELLTLAKQADNDRNTLICFAHGKESMTRILALYPPSERLAAVMTKGKIFNFTIYSNPLQYAANDRDFFQTAILSQLPPEDRQEAIRAAGKKTSNFFIAKDANKGSASMANSESPCKRAKADEDVIGGCVRKPK